jgi:hypothetical protein
MEVWVSVFRGMSVSICIHIPSVWCSRLPMLPLHGHLPGFLMPVVYPIVITCHSLESTALHPTLRYLYFHWKFQLCESSDLQLAFSVPKKCGLYTSAIFHECVKLYQQKYPACEVHTRGALWRSSTINQKFHFVINFPVRSFNRAPKTWVSPTIYIIPHLNCLLQNCSEVHTIYMQSFRELPSFIRHLITDQHPCCREFRHWHIKLQRMCCRWMHSLNTFLHASISTHSVHATFILSESYIHTHSNKFLQDTHIMYKPII